MALSVKTEKEIKVSMNGLNEIFFVVHDLTQLNYKIEYRKGSDFKHKNSYLFEEEFIDEKSAINALIECLDSFNPDPFF